MPARVTWSARSALYCLICSTTGASVRNRASAFSYATNPSSPRDEGSELESMGDDIAGADIADDDIAGDDIAGDDIAGDDIAGDDIAGDEFAGDDIESVIEGSAMS